MNRKPTNSVFLGKVHAKIFEILLILGFLTSIIFLIINFALTFWHFKLSTSLLTLEIVLLILNIFCFILSIILRVWRSNGSVFKNNFSSSNYLSIFLLVLIIISIICCIVEEVFFSFVGQFISLLNKMMSPSKRNLESDEFDDDDEFDDGDYELNKKMVKKEKMYLKIMNKLDINKFGQGTDPDSFKKKMKIMEILPWISINFNLFILLLTLVFTIFIMERIKLKSDFGFQVNPTDQSSISKNKMVTSRNSDNLGNNINNQNKKNEKKLKGKRKSKINVNGSIALPDSDKMNIKAKNKKSKRKKN